MLITRTGGPEVLSVVEDDAPEPGPGEVRVQVLATGVSFADIFMRRGMYPGVPKVPYAPGYDIVGITEKAGPGASRFAPGRAVAALTIFGGYSQWICLREDALVPVPDGLDPGEAVSLVLNYVTAHQMLHRVANTRTGQRILVHAAAGGVGTAMLELGRLAGLEMYGTASRAKHEVVRRYGATPIDYKSENFETRLRELTGNGVDAVFDPIGGRNWWRSYQALSRRGRLVVYGALQGMSGGKPAIAVGFTLLGIMKLLPDAKAVHWYSITSMKARDPQWFREDLTRLFELLAAIQIQPLIAERLPLAQAARAHQLLESGATTGKIVLMCQE